MESLVCRTRHGLTKTSSIEAVQDALVAVGILAAHPEDDDICDKWLYQAIGRAVEVGAARKCALLLADVLEARLEHRTDAKSLVSAILGAGASVNAARLELEGIIIKPTVASGQALAARGLHAAKAILELLKAIAESHCKEPPISPGAYARTLRSTLSRGAAVLESNAPFLADVAFSCRQIAALVLVHVNPGDVYRATSEVLNGLSSHSKKAPSALLSRAECFFSLASSLIPWQPAPFVSFEWFLQQAAGLDAIGDVEAANNARCTGRDIVGQSWPLLLGTLLCEETWKAEDPTLTLADALHYFCMALNGEASGQLGSWAWRRAWVALTRARALFRLCLDWTTRSNSPAEVILLILADVVVRCEWRNSFEKDRADAECVNAYWCAATFAAKRGAISEVLTRSNISEKFSSLTRAAGSFTANSTLILRRSTIAAELKVAVSLFKRAALLPDSAAVTWTGLAHCLDRLGNVFDAATAAARAACLCAGEACVRDIVVRYSRALTYTSGLPPSLMDVFRRTEVPWAKEVLSERLRTCEAENSTLVVIAAEELASWEPSSGPSAFSRAGLALIRSGNHAGTALARRSLEVTCRSPSAATVACCSLALATLIWDLILGERNEFLGANTLRAVEAFDQVLIADVETVALAALALREVFVARQNLIGEFRTCAALSDLVPQLQESSLTILPTACGNSDFGAPIADTDARMSIDSACLWHCSGGDLITLEARHSALCTYMTRGNVGHACLMLASDEAHAYGLSRVAAKVALQICDAHLRRGDAARAKNIAVSLERYLRHPQRHKPSLLADDCAAFRMLTKGILWVRLAELWLLQGCSSQAAKYIHRASDLCEAAVGWVAVSLELRRAIAFRGLNTIDMALERESVATDAKCLANIRQFYYAIYKGDMSRRLGKYEAAALCYQQAAKVLMVANLFLIDSHTRHQQATWPLHCQLILTRVVRVIDVLGYRIHALAAYRTTLRMQPCLLIDGIYLRYRLARGLFESASSNVSAAAEVLKLLRHALMTARRACQQKLVIKLSRTLTVATLKYIPGAISSALVALLAHTSFGNAGLLNDNDDDSSRHLTIWELVETWLHNPNSQCTRGDYTGADAFHDNAQVYLDRLLAPLPKTYAVVAAFISPTRHIVISRLQRGQMPITICAPVPEGVHDVKRSGCAIGNCRSILRASSASLSTHTHTRMPSLCCLKEAIAQGQLWNKTAGPYETHPYDTHQGTQPRLTPTECSINNATIHRRSWWSQRHSLDSSLEAGLDTFDQSWLGAMRALLATAPAEQAADNARCSRILQLCIYAGPDLTCAEANELLTTTAKGVVCTTHKEIVSMQFSARKLIWALHLWLISVARLKASDLKCALTDLGLSAVGLKRQLISRFSEVLDTAFRESDCVAQASKAATARQPLILALDEHLQFLPIEDLTIPRNAPTSRVPSLACALSLAKRMRLSERRSAKLASMHACCVVDPQNNLPNTRHKLFKYLGGIDNSTGPKWSCVTVGGRTLAGSGCKLSDRIAMYVSRELPDSAAYLFCGHGHGAAYLKLINDPDFMSAIFLMGCSSGALLYEGDYEPRGVPLELLARGAPVVVATLWDVTDCDVDRITIRICESMAKNPNRPIPDIINAARTVAKLRTLNGAAPVCYGLPISLTSVERARCIRRPWLPQGSHLTRVD